MTTMQREGFTVTYDDSPEVHKAVYDRILKWFMEQDHYCGDSIHQSDSTYEDAPNLLTDIAEKCFKFKEKWE